MSLGKAILILVILVLSLYGSERITIEHGFGLSLTLNAIVYLTLILYCNDFRFDYITNNISFVNRPLTDLLKATLTSIFLFGFIYSFEIAINLVFLGDGFLNNHVCKSTTTVYFLSLAFVFPFLEELLFRKGILHNLLQRYSTRKSIVISAILFSLAHLLTDSGLFSVFLVGLIIGYIYVVYRSFIIVFVVHACYNILVLFGAPWINEHMQRMNVDLSLYSAILIVFSFAMMYGINFLRREK